MVWECALGSIMWRYAIPAPLVNNNIMTFVCTFESALTISNSDHFLFFFFSVILYLYLCKWSVLESNVKSRGAKRSLKDSRWYLDWRSKIPELWHTTCFLFPFWWPSAREVFTVCKAKSNAGSWGFQHHWWCIIGTWRLGGVRHSKHVGNTFWGVLWILGRSRLVCT